MDLIKAFAKHGIRPIGEPIVFKIKPRKVGYVWTFCSNCKKVQHTKVYWLYYEYNLPPSHHHGLGEIYLPTFSTKEAALKYKKTYREPRFGN